MPPERASLLNHLDNNDKDLPIMQKLFKDQLEGWSDYEDPRYFQETISYIQTAQQMLAENQGVVVPNRPGVQILKGLPLNVPALFSQTSGAWQTLNKVQNDIHPMGPVKDVSKSEALVRNNAVKPEDKSTKGTISIGQYLTERTTGITEAGTIAQAQFAAAGQKGKSPLANSIAGGFGKGFAAFGFGYGMYDDMQNQHLTGGEAFAHNAFVTGGGLVVGEGVQLGTESYVIGIGGAATLEAAGIETVAAFGLSLTPVGWGIAIGTFFTLAADYAYQNNVGGTKTIVNNVGKALDKQLKSVDAYDKIHPATEQNISHNGVATGTGTGEDMGGGMP